MLIITTGGTIDKLPDWEVRQKNRQSMFPLKSSVKQIAKAAGARLEKTIELDPIDSIYMDDNYRWKIAEAVLLSDDSEIIVTHGTDTMVHTAGFVSGVLSMAKVRGKRIVLTGAMVPFSMGERSDAVANFRLAVAAFDQVEPGVYIAMNDQVLKYYMAKKDYQKELFLPIDPVTVVN